jgi:hypothetical protein
MIHSPAEGWRRGVTLIEMTLAGFLMTLVGVMVCQAWASFGRPAVSALARARLAQEANLAAEAISRDLGRLAAPDGPQPDSRYQNIQSVGSTLTMTIDDGDGSIRTVMYSTDPADPGKLFRTDGTGRRVVAMLIADFQSRPVLLPLLEGGGSISGVQVELTFTHRTYDRDRDGSFRGDHTRQYTLFIPDAQ